MKIQRGYVTEKSGSWLGHYSKWCADPATGIKRRKQYAEKLGATSGMTLTKAREALSKLIVKELGIVGDSRITVSAFITQRWQPLREGTWRPSTKATNEELLKVITDRFGNEALEDVDSVALQTWLNSIAKTRSGSAVKHCRIFLRSIFAEALIQKYIDIDPARLLKVPKVRAVKKDFLTMEQIKTLLKKSMPFGIRTRETCFLQLILGTALRPSEIFALRWRSIDLAKGTMTISETVYRGEVRPYGKTTEDGDLEVLLIPEVPLQALTELYAEAKRNAPDDFIFSTGIGTFWLKENFLRRVLAPIAKAAKIPHLNYQVLRRTTLTHAAQYGDLKSVQAIARHRKADTTANQYMQVIDSAVRHTSAGLAGAMFAPAKAAN
jgi:integrase